MTKEQVKYKSDGQNKFAYLDIGSGYHGRTSFRLWLSQPFINQSEEGDYVEFPVKNGEIQKTEKGNLVLRSAEGSYVFDIYVQCGYRGGSSFEILSSHGEIFEYVGYRSGAGALGISNGAMVNTKSAPLKYRWHRSGRLYGNPSSGIKLVFEDGKVENFEYLADGLESFDELPKITEVD